MNRSTVHVKTAKLVQLQLPPISVPPLLVASIDIECYSQTGDFPKATNREDRITMIGVHLSRAHDASHSRVLMFTSMPCAPLEGAELRASASERKMLGDFIAHMGRLHPEVYVSYKASVSTGGTFSNGPSYTASTCATWVRTGLPAKCCSLRRIRAMATRCNFFRSTARSTWTCSSRFMPTTNCRATSWTPWRSIFSGPHLKNRLARASDVEVLEVATFCVRDVELPFRLMHSLSLLLNKLAESETVNTTLSDLVTRGQGIKIFSYIAQLVKCSEIFNGYCEITLKSRSSRLRRRSLAALRQALLA
ncbi:DNA polymerase family B, exonuclease domain-containing protein [Pavlovales sp. CCMP2436]|nr:DNA polymerase family B, exonuclease domain-containing protein [Pavlovales sp. CCMP2436]